MGTQTTLIYYVQQEIETDETHNVFGSGNGYVDWNGSEDGGLYDYTLSAALGYAITEAWSSSAGVTYVNALDDDNLPDVDDGGLEDTNIVFSVGIAYAF